VAIKGMPEAPHAREVAGRADILVCPGIDAANILYKSIAAMVKYGQASIAGITVGFPVPYIILSRSDALETRLQSIALSSIYARRSRAAPTGETPSGQGTEGEEDRAVHSLLVRISALRELREGTCERYTARIAGALKQSCRIIGRPLADTKLVVADVDEVTTVFAACEGRVDQLVECAGVDTSPTGEEATAIAREVGGIFVALGCDCEALVLTGPASSFEKLGGGSLRRLLGRLAPVLIFPEPAAGSPPAGGTQT
jgi:hypothetical protein